MIKTTQEVGKIIKENRLKLKFTQEDLAKKLNVSFQTVSKWENGDNYPDIQLICILSDLFKISIDSLINSKNENNEKKEYMVYEEIENKFCKIKITKLNNIDIPKYIDICFSIFNKTNKIIELNQNQFMLLDQKGNSLSSAKKSISNYDGDQVGEATMHKIPAFIPPKESVNIELKYVKQEKIRECKLHINIDKILDNYKYIVRIYKTNDNYTKDEIIDYYNYKFIIEKPIIDAMPIQHPMPTRLRESIVPKISLDILDQIKYEKSLNFFKDYKIYFDNEALEKICNEVYLGWEFIRQYVHDQDKLKKIVVNNYENIENECKNGKYSSFLNCCKQPFFDKDITEFYILLCLKYEHRYIDWILEYITSDNILKFRKYITQFDYKENLKLFKSKLSAREVNKIIRESNIHVGNINIIIAEKETYKELEQETIDYLMLSFDVNRIKDIDELKKIKGIVSINVWSKIKEKYLDIIDKMIG